MHIDDDIDLQTSIPTMPLLPVNEENSSRNLMKDKVNFCMLPAHEQMENSKKDINQRIKHLLDESAILIDIDDDVNENDFNPEHFHHAQIAMIDTVSSPIEPDLCFMPRIEEREEDFLESTVDDESDEEQSISSTQHESPPAKFLMENYDFDITTHANKTSIT